LDGSGETEEFGPIRHGGIGSSGIEQTLQTPVDFDQEDRQMWESHTKNGRKPSRVFQPAVDSRLEDRVLLSSAKAAIDKQLEAGKHLLKHPNPRNAFLAKRPPQFTNTAPPFKGQGHVRKRAGVIAVQTARGGQAVEVTATDGSHYLVKLSYTSNTLATNTAEGTVGQSGAASTTSAASLVAAASASYPQPIGTVRAYPMSGGRVGIIVDGSTSNTDLTFNPLGEPQVKGYAQSFAYGESNRIHLLNVGQLTVNSGVIGAIEGFQDTELSGPLVATGTAAIDRLAFYSILPGASITTGGDVNTLDVLNGIDLSGAGTGITIGRDLNLLNVGGDITLSDGANFTIGRNLGLVAQPPKGTGTGSNILSLNFTSVSNSIVTVSIPSVGSYIQGNLTVNPGSLFTIGGDILNTMYVEGTVSAGFTSVSSTITLGYLSRLQIGAPPITNPVPPYAFLLQRILSGVPGSGGGAGVPEGTADQYYVTALGGFS
jgi:hypothetical protein